MVSSRKTFPKIKDDQIFLSGTKVRETCSRQKASARRPSSVARGRGRPDQVGDQRGRRPPDISIAFNSQQSSENEG